uniref:Late blight resistance protein n=1 Tax=Solanum tuberosum TaxID=4113 RepID=M1DZ58_SOLTU
MDVGTVPPIILTNEILKRTKSNKRVLQNAKRLTTDSEVLNWINGAPDADPNYLDLHHKMMQDNWHQYIECTSMRVGMLKQHRFEKKLKGTEELTYLNSTQHN